jgi:hypothetical protein
MDKLDPDAPADTLDIRGFIAAAALQGLLAADSEFALTFDIAAADAVSHADALIARLNKE